MVQGRACHAHSAPCPSGSTARSSSPPTFASPAHGFLFNRYVCNHGGLDECWLCSLSRRQLRPQLLTADVRLACVSSEKLGCKLLRWRAAAAAQAKCAVFSRLRHGNKRTSLRLVTGPARSQRVRYANLTAVIFAPDVVLVRAPPSACHASSARSSIERSPGPPGSRSSAGCQTHVSTAARTTERYQSGGGLSCHALHFSRFKPEGCN